MEVQPEPPIFVLTQNDDRFPLIFVAGDLDQLNDYFTEHAGTTPDPEAGIMVTSRFVDLTGKCWSHEDGGSSGVALVPTDKVVSQQELRDTVIRGHMELVRFNLESQEFKQTAADLANERNFSLPQGAPPPTSGPLRHVAWHQAKRIPIKRSH